MSLKQDTIDWRCPQCMTPNRVMAVEFPDMPGLSLQRCNGCSKDFDIDFVIHVIAVRPSNE